MRKYFQRLERCRHRRGSGAGCTSSGSIRRATGSVAGCQTEKAIPKEALSDTDLVQVIAKSALEALDGLGRAHRPRQVGISFPARSQRLAPGGGQRHGAALSAAGDQ